MEHFTPITSSLGGVLIGLSAALLFGLNGRIAGISGIAGRLVEKVPKGDIAWRFAFLGGLVVAGIGAAWLVPETIHMGISRSPAALVAAGLLVGFGTRMGGGCTSGHGVCGIGRLSTRSVVATLMFMATGAATVWIIRVLFGGVL